jgi:hypothetical protein
MEDLSLSDRASGVAERRQDLFGHAHPLRRRAVQREVGAQDVAEHQVIIRGHGRLGRGDGLAAEREEALDRSVEEVDTGIAAGLQRHAPAVSSHRAHHSLPSAAAARMCPAIRLVRPSRNRYP